LKLFRRKETQNTQKHVFFALLAFFAAIHLHSIPLLSNFGFRTSDLSQRRGWKQLEAALALIVLPEAGDGVSLPEVWRDG
jgi:hypothetical protein